MKNSIGHILAVITLIIGLTFISDCRNGFRESYDTKYYQYKPPKGL
jgi:hypothetical protein